jgi:hypothetical protein
VLWRPLAKGVRFKLALTTGPITGSRVESDRPTHQWSSTGQTGWSRTQEIPHGISRIQDPWSRRRSDALRRSNSSRTCKHGLKRSSKVAWLRVACWHSPLDRCRDWGRTLYRSVPTIDSQHESARFAVPTAARRNSDGLIINAVKNIVDAQRRAPVSINLVTGAKVEHSEGALYINN